MVRIVTQLYRPSFHFFKQNDTMDVLDEKQNGAPPPMEVDEVVSVRDRKSFRFFVELEVDFSIFSFKMKPSLPNTCRIWATT